MIRLPATPRAVGRWISFAFILLVLACTRVMLAPGTQYSGAWDTKLPPGVSSNPDVFKTGLKIVPGVVHNRLRAGTCPTCAVKVSIQSIADTYDLAPGSPPAAGLAVAHLQNLDPRNTEGYYGFRPSTVADYYFWVDKRPDTDIARITVLEVPRGPGLVRAGRQKNLQYCHKYPPMRSPGPSDADFVEYKTPCDVGPIAASSKIVEASMFSTAQFTRAFAEIASVLRAVTLISGGGWIDCNSGCCT